MTLENLSVFLCAKHEKGRIELNTEIRQYCINHSFTSHLLILLDV